jgi:uncharacterized membrane-anchored protein
MTRLHESTLAKVPHVTAAFWLLKILATTLGETGGDAVSMSMELGYLAGSAIFMVIFVVVATAQIRARHFHPFLYWGAIIASTTVGTTLADFATRDIGIGYAGGSALLLGLLAVSLLVWHRTLGTISVDSIANRRAETFYWVTIMVSQTLGTALGDWTADSMALGYLGAAVIFASMLAVLLLLMVFTRVSRTVLFWSAFVLTRPLGAVLGDFLDKPLAEGGLELSRYVASFVLVIAIGLLILWLPQRAAQRGH